MHRLASGRLPYTALRDAALLAIRKAIVEGRLSPGQRLFEVEIARELGTSRAPVREALRQLESEGLVTSHPHRGTYVTRLSQQDAREIFSLRAALEGLAVAAIVRDGNAAAMERLGQLLDEMRRRAEEGAASEIARLDFQFHETLCRAANNGRLIDIWLSMSVQIRALVSITDTQYLTPQELVHRHSAVLEAIRARRTERAKRLLIRDILEIGERVAESLAASE